MRAALLLIPVALLVAFAVLYGKHSKLAGLALIAAGALWTWMMRKEPGDGYIVGLAASAAGLLAYLEGLKEEIIKAIEIGAANTGEGD